MNNINNVGGFLCMQQEASRTADSTLQFELQTPHEYSNPSDENSIAEDDSWVFCVSISKEEFVQKIEEILQQPEDKNQDLESLLTSTPLTLLDQLETNTLSKLDTRLKRCAKFGLKSEVNQKIQQIYKQREVQKKIQELGIVDELVQVQYTKMTERCLGCYKLESPTYSKWCIARDHLCNQMRAVLQKNIETIACDYTGELPKEEDKQSVKKLIKHHYSTQCYDDNKKQIVAALFTQQSTTRDGQKTQDEWDREVESKRKHENRWICAENRLRKDAGKVRELQKILTKSPLSDIRKEVQFIVNIILKDTSSS